MNKINEFLKNLFKKKIKKNVQKVQKNIDMTKIQTKMNKKQRDFSINATSGIWQSAL